MLHPDRLVYRGLDKDRCNRAAPGVAGLHLLPFDLKGPFPSGRAYRLDDLVLNISVSHVG